MKKRIYRATPIELVDVEAMAKQVERKHLTVSIDVAKSTQFASLMLENKACLGIVKWNQLKPAENQRAMVLLKHLATSAGTADLVMEPSGTYGDPLRHRARSLGFSVHMVNPKRCRDYSEVFDGVPSQHDGKSAILLGRLHLEGISKPWVGNDESKRNLSALVREADIHQSNKTRNLGRLEAWMARHWPELHLIFPLRRATLLKLLVEYGEPQEIARAGSQAKTFMKRVGGHLLSPPKIDAVMKSARETIGVPPSEGEVRLGQAIVEELLRSRDALREVERRIEESSSLEPSIVAMSPILGRLTAVVLFVELGDPRRFPNARAYLKAAGLNLKERSSGTHTGSLRLSKRGPGIARKWLYLAVLRLVQRDQLTKAWYQKKIRRDGGKVKKKALVAVMRKLTSALWHVAKGQVFDSKKLFDVKSLGVAA